ncbi:MAG: hypothetical protein C0478_01225 [Planctomyces sp.]|nr:hypothetical protein [Planctomyces sp.]
MRSMTRNNRTCDIRRGPLHKNCSRSGHLVVKILIAIGIVFTVMALLTPLDRGREAARRTQCRINLKRIGLALHSYHDQYGSFPPAFTVDAEGKPLHSWRTLILPFIDQQALYDKIDLSKPWNDPANAEALATRLPAYCCPASIASLDKTSYMGLVGENVFLAPIGPRKLADFPEGEKSEVVAILEVDASQAVPWMSPQDVGPEYLLTFGPETKSSHYGSLHILQVDGRVSSLSSDTAGKERERMISIQRDKPPKK